MSDEQRQPYWPPEQPGAEMLFRKGEKGAKGDKGDPGMTAAVKRSIVYLFVLAVVLSGANLFWTSHEVGRVSRVSATLASEHSVQVYACGLTNQSRAEELRLWRHIIEIAAPPPHQTRSQRKARHALMAGFVSYLKRVFKPRDCAAIYQLRH